MRILGFSRKDWMNYLINKPKLEEGEFTTFRVPRKDEDWKRDEKVQVFYKPRSPNREFLGIARIRHNVPRFFFYMPDGLSEERVINDKEAKADGFPSSHLMFLEMVKIHGDEKASKQLNKLTLHWLSKAKKQKKGLDKG